jgi:hypothetical protein
MTGEQVPEPQITLPAQGNPGDQFHGMPGARFRTSTLQNGRA